MGKTRITTSLNSRMVEWSVVCSVLLATLRTVTPHMASSNAHVAMPMMIILILVNPSLTFLPVAADNTEVTEPSSAACVAETAGGCHDKHRALKFKLIAISSILASSMIGICLPLFSSRTIPALRPDRDLFVLVKAFASGVILATGYMHVLPDSYEDLQSECLPENPWRKFPFTTFVAMLAAIFILMVDSFSMSYYKKKFTSTSAHSHSTDQSKVTIDDKDLEQFGYHEHSHGNIITSDDKRQDDRASGLLKRRVVAQILEVGILVHSVVIGLSMGASDNFCTIRPLIAALCFHQLFEGMGLGGCILQAEYGLKMKMAMVLFFSITTPFGIGLGIILSNVYSENSPTSLIVVGLLNAASAGLLNYMALVDLLAFDFMGPKLQENMKLQILSYAAVLLGVGGMSLMAKWA